MGAVAAKLLFYLLSSPVVFLLDSVALLFLSWLYCLSMIGVLANPLFCWWNPHLHGGISAFWLLEMCPNRDLSWEIITNHEKSWKTMSSPRSSQSLPPFFPSFPPFFASPQVPGWRPDHRIGGRRQRFLCGALGGTGGRCRRCRHSRSISGELRDHQCDNYPLVNIQKAIEHGHLWLIYPSKIDFP